ncbi:carbohydrate ABC transporter permease [Cellulomonas sp. C5510]|uniref:carbohydrate ABC transporter permease n=1 Tax=Cellulomonas sp. C5510 TaxID=2871170 RepID=UPI001C93B412|nr:sugar ABC transporter permease [Cellulomonas sp. C5510]QZN86209.1 sugar ABC transporter permease [Cellulomonas sp. C5510]
MTLPATAPAPAGAGSPHADAREASRRRARRASRLAAFGFIAPVVVFIALFFAYPIVRTIQLSLQDYTFQSYFTGQADFVGFANYVTLVQDRLFGPVVRNTVLFTVVSLVFQFVIGLALAVFFQRTFPLSATFRALILIPWLLPVVVSATTWRWMFYKDYGIVNAVLGTHIGWLSDPQWSLWAVIIANIWLGIPFNLVLLYGGLQGIPGTLYEAAALDGAGAWRRFRSITWPLLRPVTAVTLLLGLVYTIKAFDVIWVITEGGPVDSSQTLATWSYKLSFEGGTDQSLSMGATVASLLFVVALVFGLLYIRTQRQEAAA